MLGIGDKYPLGGWKGYNFNGWTKKAAGQKRTGGPGREKKTEKALQSE